MTDNEAAAWSRRQPDAYPHRAEATADLTRAMGGECGRRCLLPVGCFS